MKKLLKNIDVTFISLVRKGANKKTIIFKSDEPDQDLIDIDIKKFDLVDLRRHIGIRKCKICSIEHAKDQQYDSNKKDVYESNSIHFSGSR